MASTERYVTRVLKDSFAIRQAARDEEAALRQIVENYSQDLGDVIAVIVKHEQWFGISKGNAQTILASLIAKVTLATRTAKAITELSKAKTQNFINMAQIADRLMKQLSTYNDALKSGAVTSKVDALQRIKEVIDSFNKDIGRLISEQYRLDENIIRVS